MTWAAASLLLGAFLLWGDPAGWRVRSSAAAKSRLGPDRGLSRLLPAWSWRAEQDGAWVAEFAEVVAVGLESGLSTVEAVARAAEIGGYPTAVGASREWGGSSPWRLIETVAEEARTTGKELGPLLARAAAQASGGGEELVFLARAWTLSDSVGAPAAPAARLAAATLRTRTRRAEQSAALVSGPRASMWMLTVLPIAGPVAVALLGGDLSAFYGSAVPVLLVLFGLVLTLIGWWWARTILRRAARPTTLEPGVG